MLQNFAPVVQVGVPLVGVPEGAHAPVSLAWNGVIWKPNRAPVDEAAQSGARQPGAVESMVPAASRPGAFGSPQSAAVSKVDRVVEQAMAAVPPAHVQPVQLAAIRPPSRTLPVGAEDGQAAPATREFPSGPSFGSTDTHWATGEQASSAQSMLPLQSLSMPS
jgi:hypothetical protein